MKISFVVPAYKASGTIGRTLQSVYEASFPSGIEAEVIVVDDGSPDAAELSIVVSSFPEAKLVSFSVNRGMCAARNGGIIASTGDIVTILDADDQLVDDWPSIIADIASEWPVQTQLCYAACQTPQGKITAQEPSYSGYLTLDDLLNERRTGEYIPLFRGTYVRRKLYADLGLRKSCGIVSYIAFALDGPFWVSNRVLRIYNYARPGSVTQGWAAKAKAAESARCYEILLERYASLYRERAPAVYRTKLLRLAVYRSLAGLPGAWQAWRKGAAFSVGGTSIASAVFLLVNPAMVAGIVEWGRRLRVIKRYG